MRHLLFFFLIIHTISQPLYSFAQDLRVSYELNSNIGTQEYFEREQIYSDFGRRRGGDSEWHRGIDYDHGNEQTLDAVLSINLGDIKDIRGIGTYKFVVVEGEDNNNFGYGHIFTNAIPQPGQGIQCGNMVLFRLDNERSGEFAIIDLNLVNHDAYGKSDLVGVQFEYNSITYTIRNDIAQDNRVGIMGSSGMISNPRIHLHLYLFDDPQIPFQQNQGWDNVTNDYDPLSVINYKNDPSNQQENFTEYDVNIIWNDDNWNNEQRSIINPSGEDESSICVRVAMQDEAYGGTSNHYQTGVMDISNVKLFIKPSYEPDENPSNWGVSNSNYKLINGPYYRSEIDLGAIIGNNRYPTNLHNAEGDLNTTGIYPWAYHDTEGYPYDDYHFSDFFTRIHKDDNQSNGTNFQRALKNDQARYPDGNYNLYAKAVSVKDNGSGNYTFTSSTTEPPTIIIDNFLPFIEKVEIIRTNDDQSQELVYGRKWSWMGTYYELDAAIQSDIYPNDQLTLKITCSESMQNLRAEVGLINYIDLTQNDEKTIWTGNFTNLLIGEIQIYIDGIDINYNYLQDGGYPLCIRESDTQWSDDPHYGNDVNHSFIVTEPSPVDFYVFQYPFDYLTMNFYAQIEEGIEVYSYSWQFGDGSSSNNENPVNEYSVSGIYDVTLTIETFNSGSYSCSKLVNVQDLSLPQANYSRQIELNDGGDRNDTYTVKFFDNSEGVLGSWIWELGSNTYTYFDQVDHNPPDQTVQIGEPFPVKLTVENMLGEDDKSETLNWDPASSPHVYLTQWETSYSSREFIVDVRNLDPPYDYRIEYGDGTNEILSSEYSSWVIFDHVYFNQGDFLVTVYVEDNESNKVSNAVEVTIRFWDLNIDVNYNSEITPPYPYRSISLTAASSPSCGSYRYTWFVNNIGDPNFQITEACVNGCEAIEFLDFSLPEAGTYRAQVFVNNAVFGEYGYGVGGLTFEVVNAPDYIHAGIFGNEPILVGLNSIQTFYADIESGPIGSPGISNDEWYPTNQRWTILRYDETTGEEIIFGCPTEESFPYQDYIFVLNRSATFDFNGWEEGEYILRFEYWNQTHQYETNGYLHPKYEHTISFYDYDEKSINVTDDYATLVLTQPPHNDNELDFYADGGTSEIKISNPGTKKIIWNAEIQYLTEEVDWIQIQNPTGENLNNINSPASIDITITQKDNFGERYAQIYIHAQLQDQNANPDLLINNVAVIHINQFGIDGPNFQYVSSNNTFTGQDFGFSSSIYKDFIVVGAPGNYNGFNGSAFVFYRNDIGVWEQIAQLIPSSTIDRNVFGNDIDIFEDYIIVGNNSVNKAFIFKKPQGGWNGVINEHRILSGEGSFGNSVAIWGYYAVVGAPFYDIEGKDDVGKVYIFERNKNGNDEWGLMKEITHNSQKDYFGYDVDIYNDILVVGAPQHTDWPGFIKIYNRNLNSSNDWGLVEALCASNLGIPYSLYNAKLGKKLSIFDKYITSLFSQPVDGTVTHLLNSIRFKLGESDWDNLSYPEEWDNQFINYSFWSDDNYVESSAIYINNMNEMQPIHGFPLATYGKGGIYQPHSFRAFTEFFYNNVNDNGGKSVLGNYRYYGVGFPGKDGYGSVKIFNKQYEGTYNSRPEYKSLCEASLDLTLINFEILPGTYPLIEARELTLGGEGYPAIIQGGAEINYEGKEITLLPGFEAENGSLVEINAYDCEPQIPPDMKTDDYLASFGNFNCGDCEGLDKRNNLLEVNLLDVLAYMAKEYSDYPWYTINILEDINKIELVNKEYEIISQIENPHPKKCCFNKERSINEDQFLLIYINKNIFKVKI